MKSPTFLIVLGGALTGLGFGAMRHSMWLTLTIWGLLLLIGGLFYAIIKASFKAGEEEPE